MGWRRSEHVMDETAYLLRSPRNAKRLLESIGQLESGEAACDRAVRQQCLALKGDSAEADILAFAEVAVELIGEECA